jgi:transcription elongation factor GreA-like protein
MDSRKCIYTGKEAIFKDHPVPKDGETAHNWANRAPISPEYKEIKQNRLPTELEMEANRIFYMLELARLDVVFLTAKLSEIQGLISEKKKEEVGQSYHLKDLTDSFEEKIKDFLTPTKIEGE